MADDDDLSIPKFLRLTNEERKAAWEKFKPKKRKEVQAQYDSRKPASLSYEEWEERKAERKIEEEQKARELEAQKRAKAPKPTPVDITGKRWNQRKGRWEKDTLAHLTVRKPAAVPAPARKPKSSPNRAVSASGFGIPEGTLRDKLAKAMAKRLGEMVSLTDWSVMVYGKENTAACARVMDGFIYVLKKTQAKFEIVKDKNDKGQITFGLYEIGEGSTKLH